MRTLSSISLLLILLINSIAIYAQQRKIDSLEKLLRLRAQQGSYIPDTVTIKLLNAVVWQMSNYNKRLDTAFLYAKHAIDISEKTRWKKGIIESYSCMAKVYEAWNKNELAIDYYIKSVNMSKEANEKDWTASGLYFVGQVYRKQGDFPIALDYYLQALRLNEETKNNADMARDLTYIGFVYTEIEDYPNALSSHQRALDKYQQVKNKFWVAINLNAIAAIYKNQNDFSKALEYYSKVLDMQKGNVYSTYGTFIDIGDVYRNQYNASPASKQDTTWERAMDYYSRGLKVASDIHDSYSSGIALNGIGWLYLKKNKLKEGGEALNKALKLLQEDKRPDAIGNCYLNLSLLDSMKGDWKSSLSNFKLYTAIADSLFNKKKSRLLAQTQIRYETDKKQNEIEILNKDNELKNLKIEQQSKNILLIISIGIILLLGIGGFAWYRNKRIKQQALKQISEAKLASLKSLMDKHFIFSSLHSIDTFLMNNDTEAASDYLVKYSKLIRSILEMSYQPEVSLAEEISLCKSYLDLEKIRLNRSFDYEFSIDQDISMDQTQFPSMLLQPLVENAVKHGIGSITQDNPSHNGFIKIDINRIKDKIVCNVTDNGKGLQFTSSANKSHRSYSGKGIIERVRVYNTLRKNRASFLLKDNNPGVTAVLTLPYIYRKQSVAV